MHVSGMLVAIASIISKQISTGKSLDLQRGFARIGRSDANIIAWIWGLSEGHVFLTSASGRLFYMSYETPNPSYHMEAFDMANR